MEKPIVFMELLSNYINTENSDPQFAHRGDAGIDLRNCGDSFEMKQNMVYKIPTGLKMDIPEGWCGLVLERSGLGYSIGATVHGRVIDSGYRGEICVLMSCIGVGGVYHRINQGDRVAQIVFVPHLDYVQVVPEVSDNTDRSGSGFGSTGVK